VAVVGGFAGQDGGGRRQGGGVQQNDLRVETGAVEPSVAGALQRGGERDPGRQGGGGQDGAGGVPVVRDSGRAVSPERAPGVSAGIAINPPGRTIPPEVGESRAFAEAYVRYLKSQHVNIFRLTTDQSQVWFDVCDELGMMMYAGRYGSPPGADEGKRVAPKDLDRCIAGYRKLWESYVSHPCIVMYCWRMSCRCRGRGGRRSASC